VQLSAWGVTDVAPELRQRQPVIKKVFACSDLPDATSIDSVARFYSFE
jgi:hypothetical protein